MKTKAVIKTKSFSLASRTGCFRYAFNGLRILFKTEANAFIHLGAALSVTVLGFWLGLSSLEWTTIAFAIGFVFAAELFNSAIEYLADVVSPGFDSGIKKVKDLAAAGVLAAAITAFVIGLIVFVPKIFG